MPRPLFAVAAVLLAAFAAPAPPPHGADTDRDGWIDEVDCAATHPGIFPGADDVCDRLDNDCDGDVDEADDTCDGVDNDCDGRVDEWPCGDGVCGRGFRAAWLAPAALLLRRGRRRHVILTRHPFSAAAWWSSASTPASSGPATPS